MEWFMKVMRNYIGFNGRARRKEYWMFFLIYFIISVVVIVLEYILGISPILSGIFSLATILPSLAVLVRRLHDTGRSGWWILISLIPVIGGIVLLVFTCLDSEPETNEYGPNPKESY